IRTEAADTVLAAWYRYQSGQWQEVVNLVEKMFKDHPDWEESIARLQQREAAKLGFFPQASTERELTPIFKKFWAVYHLGTAHFQAMVAYQNLGNHEKALEHAKEIITNYSWAQCWDPHGDRDNNPETGWMWQIIISLQREYSQLYKEAMKQTGEKKVRLKKGWLKTEPALKKESIKGQKDSGKSSVSEDSITIMADGSFARGSFTAWGDAAANGNNIRLVDKGNGWSSVVFPWVDNISNPKKYSLVIEYSDNTLNEMGVQTRTHSDNPNYKGNSQKVSLKHGEGKVVIPLRDFGNRMNAEVGILHFGPGFFSGDSLNNSGGEITINTIKIVPADQVSKNTLGDT
ncbi:MAG: tetratricopeptide repeat protein, partial [Candidatus Heimdallarchaeota archaeon]|nr:tetratricopeptide repeat protein [Candidatus Heimdallarchaeota archaeon]